MWWEKQRQGDGGGGRGGDEQQRRVQFITLCLLWYLSSALTSNTSKTILNTVQRPITLTFVQFGMISGWCVLTTMVWRAGGLRRRGMRIMVPSRRILSTTLPMCGFQIAGHVFGSMATSKVPVSVVHTVKALSPLFTVLAYRLVFGVRYSPSTYASLLPLTLGVMLACSLELSANVSGLACALGSCLVFVSQNMFTKMLVFTEDSVGGGGGLWWWSTSGPKPDKINIMFYSSGMAFVLMMPMWLYETVPSVAATTTSPSAQPILALYLFNGTAHFAQNVIAFTILSIASPVAYSIAGLVKRIFVIVMSIMWFGQPTTLVQALGIVMTFVFVYVTNSNNLASLDCICMIGHERMSSEANAKSSDLRWPSTSSYRSTQSRLLSWHVLILLLYRLRLRSSSIQVLLFTITTHPYHHHLPKIILAPVRDLSASNHNHLLLQQQQQQQPAITLQIALITPPILLHLNILIIIIRPAGTCRFPKPYHLAPLLQIPMARWNKVSFDKT